MCADVHSGETLVTLSLRRQNVKGTVHSNQNGHHLFTLMSFHAVFLYEMQRVNISFAYFRETFCILTDTNKVNEIQLFQLPCMDEKPETFCFQ